MKKIVLLFYVFFLIHSLKAQIGEFDIEEFDPTEVNNWLDPSYKDFFSQPVIYNKIGEVSKFLPIKTSNKAGDDFKILVTNDYNQGANPSNQWSQIIMGETGVCTKTISYCGCAITCQAMILKSRGFNYDPGTWDAQLKYDKGYSSCGLLFQKEAMYNNTVGNYYYTSKQYPVTYRGSSDDYMAALVLKYWIDRGGYAIIKVNKIGKADGTVRSTGSHFMLVKGYYTSNPSLKDFIVSDPGTVYDDDKNLKLEHYYNNAVSPLIISKTGYPTIRIYANISASAYQPPEMPIFTPYLATGDYFNISLPTNKSTNFNFSWILKRNGAIIDTQKGQNYSYYLTKPGNYTITLIVGGDQGVTETTKSFTVTGDPIIVPGDCASYIHTISNKLVVTHTSISFIYETAADYEGHCNESCNWNCTVPAIKAIGPDFEDDQHGCTYNFSKLKPNSHYKFWVFKYPAWECNEFWYCKYNDDLITDCYANIITTPKEFKRNSKLTESGNVIDKAFNNILLTSGFSYKPQSVGDSYSAKIATGKQFWITCVDCDKKKSEQEPIDNVEKSCDIDTDTDLIAQDSVISKHEGIESKLKIHIYPNPSKDIFNIDINKNVDFDVIVYNLQREILYLKNSNQINLSDYPSGGVM